VLSKVRAAASWVAGQHSSAETTLVRYS
jgi:hypothetical protein